MEKVYLARDTVIEHGGAFALLKTEKQDNESRALAR